MKQYIANINYAGGSGFGIAYITAKNKNEAMKKAIKLFQFDRWIHIKEVTDKSQIILDYDDPSYEG